MTRNGPMNATMRCPTRLFWLKIAVFRALSWPTWPRLPPQKKPRNGELTDDEKALNRLVSQLRIRIEHAIGGVKRYRMVKDKLRNWKSGFRDTVIETCCGLHHFRLQFRPWHYDIPHEFLI
jgi:hypothetical protein